MFTGAQATTQLAFLVSAFERVLSDRLLLEQTVLEVALVGLLGVPRPLAGTGGTDLVFVLVNALDVPIVATPPPLFYARTGPFRHPLGRV